MRRLLSSSFRNRLFAALLAACGEDTAPAQGGDSAGSASADTTEEKTFNIDLATAYFVLCAYYNFRGASLTNQRLYEMAARGICVAVGVRSLPREYEFICQAFFPEDLL